MLNSFGLFRDYFFVKKMNMWDKSVFILNINKNQLPIIYIIRSCFFC